MFRQWYLMLNELGTWLQINGIVISMWFCMIRPHFTARWCGIFGLSQLLKFHSNEMWSKSIEIFNSWGWFHFKMNRYESESGLANDIKNCPSSQFQLLFFHLFVCYFDLISFIFEIWIHLFEVRELRSIWKWNQSNVLFHSSIGWKLNWLILSFNWYDLQSVAHLKKFHPVSFHLLVSNCKTHYTLFSFI